MNSGGQLFRFRASAVSVNQCMGPEGKKQGEKEIRRRRGGEKEKSAGRPFTEQEHRKGRNIPSFLVTQSSSLFFFLAKGTTKLNRRDDRGIFCLPHCLFIFFKVTCD